MDEMATIDKALNSVCKGEDKKSDALMMMSRDSNWDQFLTPAPCAIALLGDLILISADTDFSLQENPPRDGFKLLRYPNSFRASLVQVSNAGWSAFNEAHTNMDQIRLHNGNVDDHVKHAVKFLMKGTPEEVKKMLPLSMSKIQYIADESLRLAQAIEDRFVSAMELTGELLEASTNTKGVYDKHTKETEIAIEVAKTERNSMMEDMKRTEETLVTINKEVTEAHTDFRSAFQSVPTENGLIKIVVCEAFLDGMRDITNFSKSMVQASLPLGMRAKCDSQQLDTQVSEQRVYSQVSIICNNIKALATIVICHNDNNGPACPDMGRIAKDELNLIQQFIEMSRKHVALEMSSGVRDKVLAICDATIAVCTSLKPLATSMTEIDDKDGVILKAVTDTEYLLNESRKLDTEASIVLQKNPLYNKSPHLSKMPTDSISSTTIRTASENARFKTELAKEILKDAKQRQEKAASELQKSNDKLNSVLVDMAKLDLKKIDFDTIRETLVKGIKALAEVREQWGKLVRFFQMLSNLIKCCLHTSLTDFVNQATEGRDIKMTNHDATLSNIYRDVIFEQASKASQVAHVVRTIAGTYVKVSNDHLMDQISCLGRLVALDPKKDDYEIKQKREELHNGCEEAQRAIISLVRKEKEEFNAQIEERIRKIQEIEKDIPAIAPEKMKEIQSNVVSGMEAFTDESIDELI